MDYTYFFLSILLLIFLGRFLGLIFSKYKFQSLIGEVLGGIILSPAIIGILYPNDTLRIFSQFGIIMLMLLSGLLTDFKSFKEYKKASVIVGMMGVVFSIILIFFALIFFGLSWGASLFISVILSNTAVEICARLMMESSVSKEIHAIVMGASFVDDIIAVFLIGVVGSMTLGEEITVISLTIISIKVIAFILISLILLPYLFEKFSVIDNLIGTSPNREKILLTFTILFAIMFAIIAQYSGLQGVIGAYIGGLIVGEWGSKIGPMLKRRVAYEDLVDDIEPISHALFTPLFFGFVGLQLGAIISKFGISLVVWILVIVISILAIAGKFIGCGIGSKLSGLDWRSSGFVGVAMGGRGALELVLLSFGYDKGIIPGDIFAAVILVTLITVIITPILLTIYEKRVKLYP